MPPFRTLFLLLTFAVVSPLFAQEVINADRPGIADSSAVTGRGVFQIETGFEREHTRDAGVDERTLTTPTLLRYGLTDALELRLEGDGYERVRDCALRCTVSHDWAPVSIGAKYRFHDHPSLGVIARAFVINADRSSGDVRLAADFDLNENWSINPNIGFSVGDDAQVLAAVTLQRNLTQRANVFVDGGLEGSDLLLDAGGAYVIGRDTQLDVSVGWGAHGSAVPNVFWSAGISRRF